MIARLKCDILLHIGEFLDPFQHLARHVRGDMRSGTPPAGANRKGNLLMKNAQVTVTYLDNKSTTFHVDNYYDLANKVGQIFLESERNSNLRVRKLHIEFDQE